MFSHVCLQCFEVVGWVAGRASGLQKTEWRDAGVVMCLGQGADLHTAHITWNATEHIIVLPLSLR